MIYVLGPTRQKRSNESFLVINTTSRAGWSSGLSPFLLGPCFLYGNNVSKNMENGWQYAKVYKKFVNSNGDVCWSEYFQWAENGWGLARANRYPMGKGAKPEFSFWDGEQLGYIEARKKIYIPLYAKAVYRTPAFVRLCKLYNGSKDIGLWDFDGYDPAKYKLGSMKDVVNFPGRPMGHAFVLKMILEKDIIFCKSGKIKLFGEIIN